MSYSMIYILWLWVISHNHNSHCQFYPMGLTLWVEYDTSTQLTIIKSLIQFSPNGLNINVIFNLLNPIGWFESLDYSYVATCAVYGYCTDKIDGINMQTEIWVKGFILELFSPSLVIRAY